MHRIVGIGEYAVSNSKNDIIKTFALASCVAVTAYSPSKASAGMIHIALPYPTQIKEKSIVRTCHYASTGIPLFIDRMCSLLGCPKDELVVNIFGGADSTLKDDIFNIGKKNIEAVKAILDKMNIKYGASHVGGTQSRTLHMEVATGKIVLQTQPIII
jgi:chemotaxis protein CheD